MSSNPLILKPACLKTLSAVEARPERSRQHEFNGVSQLKDMFGLDKFEKTALFHLRGGPLSDRAKVTWYDARADHPTRTEHRLYFQGNVVMDQAQEGDNILIGFDRAGVLNCILIKTGAEGYRENIPNWQVL